MRANILYEQAPRIRYGILLSKFGLASNKVSLDTVNAVFALPFQRRLAQSIDILLFNPPYVPTSDQEAQEAQETSQIQASWAGGADGMSVTERFLQMVPVSGVSPSQQAHTYTLSEALGPSRKVLLSSRQRKSHICYPGAHAAGPFSQE